MYLTPEEKYNIYIKRLVALKQEYTQFLYDQILFGKIDFGDVRKHFPEIRNMKLLKKLFQKNYCSKCEYKRHYLDLKKLNLY